MEETSTFPKMVLGGFLHLANNGTHVEEAKTDTSGIVSYEVFYIFEMVIKVTLTSIVSVFGIVANIINIVVFLRMGVMKDSSNVTLMSLAITDFWSMISLLLLTIMTLIQLLDLPDLNWDPEAVLYIAAGWPHLMFVQMSCWITVFIAFERCMCVVFPFKVKTLFSAKRSVFVLACFLVYFILTFAPILITQRLAWQRDALTNTTRYTAYFAYNFKIIEDFSQYLNFVISPTVSMIAVAIFTKLTASRVQSSSDWRMTKSNASKIISSTTDQNGTETSAKQELKNASSQKERNLIKMITMICIVFLICNTPSVLMIYIIKIIPQVRHRGLYHNFFHLYYGFSFFLESVNASVNIFIYYRLSTRYRQVFRESFCLK